MFDNSLRKIKYRADALFSGGTTKMLLFIILISVVASVLSALVSLIGWGLSGVDPGHQSFVQAMMKLVGIGGSSQDDPLHHRLHIFALGAFALLFTSVGVGILTTGIQSQLNRLRRGRSLVLETGHTVILGWSSKISTVITEIAEANRSESKSVIVVLADRDKVDMEDYLNAQLPNLHGTKLKLPKENYKSRNTTTRVICRSGNPSSLADLSIASPETARSIIMLADKREGSDSETIKRSLAIKKLRAQSDTDQTLAVAEVIDDSIVEAVKECGVKVIRPDEIVSRLLVQSTLHPGLSLVYEELLSFTGSEIYLHNDDSLAGKPLNDIVNLYENPCVIGIQRAAGDVELAIDSASILELGDSLIVVCEDDSLIKTQVCNQEYETVNSKRQDVPAIFKENILILGWNRFGVILIKELEEFLHDESSIAIAVDDDDFDDVPSEIREGYSVITLQSVDQNSISKIIEKTRYSHVVLLADRRYADHQAVDSKTLLRLVHLRSIIKTKNLDISISAEILDEHNRELAFQEANDDYIASDRLVAGMIAQLSENCNKQPILEELMSGSRGAEIYLMHPESFVDFGENFCFGSLVKQGANQMDYVIGIMKKSEDGNLPHVELCPPKSKVLNLVEGDKVIVVSQD